MEFWKWNKGNGSSGNAMTALLQLEVNRNTNAAGDLSAIPHFGIEAPATCSLHCGAVKVAVAA